MEYFVFITNKCNLNCEYCSVTNGDNSRPLRPNYTAEELHRFIRSEEGKFGDGEVSLYFFGGEPTLDYEHISHLIKFFKKNITQLNCKFILHTNGLLLRYIPAYIISNLDVLMLSVNYEKIPKYNLGNSYFSTIIKGIHWAKNCNNIPTIARLTITENTSLFTESLQVLSFFDYIYWQIENRFEFTNYELFSTSYMYELKLLFDYWLKYLKQGVILNIIPFLSVLKFMFLHDRSENSCICGYSNSMVYIQTDGKCYACSDNMDSGVHEIGSIHDGIKLKQINIDLWACGSCDYKKLCMGRCARMHLEFSDPQRSKYCDLNQYMFNMFIEQKSFFEEILEDNSIIKERINNGILTHTEFIP